MDSKAAGGGPQGEARGAIVHGCVMNGLDSKRGDRFIAWLLGAAALLVSGCQVAPEQVKTDLDDYVYSAIDYHWDETFGIQAGHRVEEALPMDVHTIQATIPADGVLTLPHALALAMANNPLYQIEKDTLYTKALDLRLIERVTLHPYGPSPIGGARASYVKDDAVAERDWVGFLGFNQLLGTGGVISADLVMGYADIISGDVRSGATRVFSAMIDQPLMRGAGREVAMERLTQAERDVLHQIRQFNRFRKELVVEVTAMYYDVLEREGNMRHAQQYEQMLNTIHERAAALAEVGIVAVHEVEEIAQERRNARDAYLRAKTDYEALLDEYKQVWLGIPPQVEFRLDLNELELARTFSTGSLGFSEAEAVETAMSLRLDLANTADRIVDAERKVRVAANLMGTGLNLVGTYNHRRTSDGVTTDPWAVDVVLDLPLDRTAEENEYGMARLLLEQAKRAHEERRNVVALQVRQAYRKLAEAHDRYQLQTESRDKAQARLDKTQLLLQYKRAGTRDVLRAAEDVYTARDEALDATADFARALMEFYGATEVLQVKADGTWYPPGVQEAEADDRSGAVIGGVSAVHGKMNHSDLSAYRVSQGAANP